MSNRIWRIAMIGLYHESNTFIGKQTTMSDFENGHLFFGEEILTEYKHAYHEIGGMIEIFQQNPVEMIPVMYAEATPGGMLDTDTSNQLIEKMIFGLRQCGKIDGLMVMPHGAAVSEIADDFDGLWLSLLRDELGTLPIIGTLDPHANLSEKMVQATDALIAYKSNPHIDQRAVGIQAASLMLDTLRGRINPVQRLLSSRVAISIEQQYTSAQPCLDLYLLAAELEETAGVLSTSILLGFPYADVYEMGSAFLVVTDNNPAQAEEVLGALEEYIQINHRKFEGQKVSVDEAMARVDLLDKPVLLLDMGDNVGGGSPGDSTFLLHALESKNNCRSFICLNDPVAVAAMSHLKPGESQEFSIGAKTDQNHGSPLKTMLRLQKIVDGKFSESEPRHGGQVHFSMGPTVIAETPNGTTVMLTSLRTLPFSLQQLLHFNINPLDYDVVVAKGVQAPIAAYAKSCPSIIRVNTAGVTSADMLQFDYKKRRRPLFPFEAIEST